MMLFARQRSVQAPVCSCGVRLLAMLLLQLHSTSFGRPL
jgi:hypothetical protein